MHAIPARSGGSRTTPALFPRVALVAVTAVLLAVFLLVLLLAGPAAAAPEQASFRAMVVFAPDAYGNGSPTVVERAGGRVSDTLDEAGIVVARLTPGAALRLSRTPGVLRVEEDAVVRASGQSLPWGITKIGAPTVWAAPVTAGFAATRADGVNVAIIDTGIDQDHPDLAANIEGGYMAIDANGAYATNRSWDDDQGHGTHVAGIVGAVDNTAGVVGAGPGVDLWAVKVLDSTGSGYFSDIIEALDWAVGTRKDLVAGNDIQVVNMSLGANGGSTALADAVKRAANAGILLFAAAGNDSSAVDYPAAYAEVVAVAATDSKNKVASWSSKGPEVELSAPGVSIYSTYRGGGYRTLSGTSMAAPHAAASAALLLGTGTPAADVRSLLRLKALDIKPAGWDRASGYGLVRPDRALGLAQ